MDSKILILASSCCLLSTSELGCATRQYIVQTLESDSILAVMEESSGSELPLKKGQIISVYSNDQTYWKMAIQDVSHKRIQGKLGTEDVEIRIEDIERIDVWGWKTNMDEATPELLGWVLGPAIAIAVGKAIGVK